MSAPNELSFLPDDYLERKARRRANVICGALSVIVLAGVGGAFAVTERSMAAAERRHDEVVHTYAEAAKRIEQVKGMHDQQRKIVQHAELAASLVEKVPRSNILAELTNSLPAGMSMLEFSLEAKQRIEVRASTFDQKKAALESQRKTEATGLVEIPREEVPIKLTGVADTDVGVAQYISKLSQSPLFRDVNLVISETFKQGNETMRRFQIEMVLNPRAEVLDITKASKTAALEMK